MNIEGYTWITGKELQRSWGTEYRFTVRNRDGRLFDEIVMLPKKDMPDKEIVPIIVNHMKRVDVPPPPPEMSPEERKQKEIEAFLVGKELLAEGQDVWSIKSKSELTTEVK